MKIRFFVLNFIATIALMAISFMPAQAQVNARMFQYPDVSSTHITFTYAGDIWLVPKTGGTANKLSSPSGTESFPRFSTDGSKIAFTGNYDGNSDIYVLPTMGGSPKRVTHHGMSDRLLDWYPGENALLFSSSRESGRQRYNQFYKVGTEGGLPVKLPVAYGEFGQISPDGKSIAYTPKSRSFRTWKRYRGGTAADIWIFNLETLTSENITNNVANDEHPMWYKETVYFISDRGRENRFNIWSYNTKTKNTKQLTKFKDFDIHFPSIGPSDLVFEAGGKLYLMDLKSEKFKEVKIKVFTDNITLNPKTEKVQNLVRSAWVSADGKRAVVEARGEIFSVPAEHGYVKNLTNSSGVAERYPAWSPNGQYIAYWSDQSGEYELYMRDMDNKGAEKKMTSYGPGYRYSLFWSPDSKKLTFIDNTQTIHFFDTENNQTTRVDQGLRMMHGGLANFKINWSSDSRWLTYSRTAENGNTAVYIYDTKEKALHQATSGYYADINPTFDPDGKYLYFLSNRSFSPVYSDMDNSFVYPNSTNIAAVSLRDDVPSPLAPRNDETEITKEEKEEKEEKKGEEEEKEEDEDEKKSDEKTEEDKDAVKIDFEGFERRVVLLPPKAGNYNTVQATSGKVFYRHFPNSGSGGRKSAVKYFDLKEREEKTLIDDVNFYLVSANGKKALVGKRNTMAIIDLKPNQKMEKMLRLDEMEMLVEPKAEWKQIFNDAWRLERDYFYDKDMHGVDWDAMKIQYGKMIEDAVTRGDVNYILGELIGELNASHAYKGGGDAERSKRKAVGYLGVDWKIENGYYRIDKFIRGANWDVEVRSPLDMPGVEVEEGDYVLAVNGRPLSIQSDPYKAFEGLAGKTVELTVSSHPNQDSARSVIVETLRDETRLRHLSWIEANRKYVEEASGGKIGYIYVRSTGIDGQNELVRQFMGQWNKQGLIIDERWNSGGQIPDRFIELLNRKPLAYWAVRDGENWQWPPVGNFGAKAMLINGWSGSGGDAFPDYFRKAGLGPLIGSRTWGGLIGISGAPGLIDGGVVTVPTFRMYDPDGEWFKEGHGVDPDIEVLEDPTQLAKGKDTQLIRAVEEVLKNLGTKAHKDVQRPGKEKR
ncbi:MAG: peptidase S41 [Bacteroidetes bacterium]|nr:peptidase S41 [Bacteroidota bacterium]